MAELILHHYPTSPFAEKVRKILGAKKLAWRSVVIPRILPKPDVVALTGGYRKTPILQIGADIYCDTALIAKKLEQIRPAPPLYPRAHVAAAQRLAQWSDSTLFQVAVSLMFQPTVLEHIFADAPEQMKAFIDDRIAMRKTSNVRRIPVAEARPALTAYLRDLDAQLADGRSFLFDGAPSIADFSMFHPLWFIRRGPPVAPMLEAHRHVQDWMARMDALGQGNPTEMSSAEAIAVAQAAGPSAMKEESDVEDLRPGDEVAVLPTDYGIDPVVGVLAACNLDEIAVRRTDPRAGGLVVHFPRIAYEIRKPA
jgi:glutathione S-transferase